MKRLILALACACSLCLFGCAGPTTSSSSEEDHAESSVSTMSTEPSSSSSELDESALTRDVSLNGVSFRVDPSWSESTIHNGEGYEIYTYLDESNGAWITLTFLGTDHERTAQEQMDQLEESNLTESNYARGFSSTLITEETLGNATVSSYEYTIDYETEHGTSSDTSYVAYVLIPGQLNLNLTSDHEEMLNAVVSSLVIDQA